MKKTRYKLRKEQLENVVESFVMESTGVKTGIEMKKKQSSDAKKHKMSMGAEQTDDSGEGMVKAKEVKTSKKKHAPEAKKHVTGSVSETRLAQIKKIMSENNISEEELGEAWFNKSQGGEDSFKTDLKVKARSFKSLTGKTLSNDEAKALYMEAKNDDFAGNLVVTAKGPNGELVYKTANESKSRSGSTQAN